MLKRKNALQKTIERLTRENAELKAENEGLKASVDLIKEVQMQKVEELDTLIDNVRHQKAVYDAAMKVLDESREQYEKSKQQFYDLKDRLRKQVMSEFK